MVRLPAKLTNRLSLPEAHALRRALAVIADELPGVYADNVRDQRPRDNANIFGSPAVPLKRPETRKSNDPVVPAKPGNNVQGGAAESGHRAGRTQRAQ